jgi:hypothetical protein
VVSAGKPLHLPKEVQAPQGILIVRGSSAHYTIDAKLMQEKLGIPTINIATDGPIGLDVILPSVADVIKKGDTVILIPEYLLLVNKGGFGDHSGQFSAAIGKPGLGNVPPKELAQDLMLLGIPTLKAATKSSLDVVQKGRLTGYYSDPVTANGDPTVLKKLTKSKWWLLKINDSVSPHSLWRIQQFKQEVEAKGATLVLGLSWIYGSTDTETLSNIRKIAEELGKIAPLLYDRETFNVKTDDSLFVDTHYHLNPDGRHTHSDK